jgi:hypothetical protein
MVASNPALAEHNGEVPPWANTDPLGPLLVPMTPTQYSLTPSPLTSMSHDMKPSPLSQLASLYGLTIVTFWVATRMLPAAL